MEITSPRGRMFCGGLAAEDDGFFADEDEEDDEALFPPEEGDCALGADGLAGAEGDDGCGT